MVAEGPFSFSELIAAAHEAARQAIAVLPASNRGTLSRLGPYQQTHFYAWLRGEDGKLSVEHVDQILLSLGLAFYTYGGSLSCSWGRGGTPTNGKRIAWNLVDWSKRNGRIAAEVGTDETQVSRARSRHDPIRGRFGPGRPRKL